MKEDNQDVITELKEVIQELKAAKRESASSLALDHSYSSKWEVKKWKRKFIISLSTIIIITSILSILFVTLNRNNVKEERGTFVEQIRDMSSLASAQAFVKVVIQKEDNELFGKKIETNLPGTKRKLLLIVPATVIAGVELEEITENDIKVDEQQKSISITIPKATILQEPSINMDKVETFSVEGLFRSDVDWDESYELAAEAKKEAEEEAIMQGIFEVAEDNARKTLTKLFAQTGYKVSVQFEQ